MNSADTVYILCLINLDVSVCMKKNFLMFYGL